MSDFTIPPYVFTYLPIVAIVLSVLAFVAITLPLAKKPIAGTTLRRQSIIAIIAATIAMFYSVMSGIEMVLTATVVAAFIGVYYKNHLFRAKRAEEVAREKRMAREAQLASFLAEVDEEASPS
jgi:predicted membrane protein